MVGGTWHTIVFRYNVDGTPDTTFNATGKKIIELANRGSAGWGVAIQPDGKIVICGNASSVVGSPEIWEFSLFILRLNADGSRDTTFGSNGQVVIPVASHNQGTFLSMAVAPDGKLVIAGDKNSSMWVLKFNANGSPDTTFGFNGSVTTNGGGIGGSARTVAVASDGKIVVGGCRRVSNYEEYSVVRFLPDGSLDTTLNGTGIGGVFGPGCVSDVLLEPDGDMIISGANATERLKPTGQRDANFNGAGYVLFGGRITRQPDGKIVVMRPGPIAFGQLGGVNTRRYNEDGSLDTSFAVSAQGNTAFTQLLGIEPILRGLNVDSEGHIIAVSSNTKIVRYDGSGNLDQGFGTQGLLSLSSEWRTAARKVFSLADGKTLAIGDYGMMRFLANGSLDTSFGDLGKVTLFSPGTNDRVVASTIQSDGKSLMAINVVPSNDSEKRVLVARYNVNGTIDETFGYQGTIGLQATSASALAVLPSGKIIVTADKFSIFRLESSGAPDLTFGNDGVARFSLPPFEWWGFYATVLPDESILVYGHTPGTLSSLVLRVNEKGIDTTFGNGGSVYFDRFEATSVAVQEDGNIVVGGSYSPPSMFREFGLIRLHPSGVVDTSFGSDGLVSTNIANWDDMATNVKIDANGHIWAVGHAGEFVVSRNQGDFAIVSYNSNGSLNQNWGTGGIATVDLIGADMAHSMDFDHQGRIVVAGESGLFFTVARFLSARSTFQMSGRVIDPAQRGVRNATVVLTDSQGQSRTVTTSTFGYFSFENVAGGNYTLSVNSRRYRFMSQQLSVADDLTGLLLEGIE